MFSEDDLDSILFGKPDDLSADEFKYFDTPGIGSITGAALPFHDESFSLFGIDPVASSSNFNVDLLDVDAPHPGGLTLHVDIIDRGTSSNTNAGSTSRDDRLQDASFATQTKHSPNPGYNLQNIAHTNPTQPSTLPLLNNNTGSNINAVQPLPLTTSSLQHENTSLEGPTGPPREQQRSPSSSPHWGSCLTARSKPPLNLDWNPIYRALGLTGWDTYDPDAATNDASVSLNTQSAGLYTDNYAFDATQFSGFIDTNDASVSSNTQSAELYTDNYTFDATQFSGFIDTNDASGSSHTQSTAFPANNDAFDATELLYSNADSTPCINNTQSAELQLNNYVSDLTEPEYFPSPSPLQQNFPSWNIEQQTPTNVTQPFAVAPQYSPPPGASATPIPSYTQPTNFAASLAIQPQNHPLKPSSSPENTRQLIFPNVAPQSSTSFIQHHSLSLENNSHSRQSTQVAASQASSQSPVKQASQAKRRRVMNMPPPQSTPAANAPHQYYSIPNPDENTPIPSQSRPNQVPVNNLNPAFFPTPPQYEFNPGPQTQNSLQRAVTNVPLQQSPASLPPNGRQYTPGSIPPPQAQGPSVNMPLNRQQIFPGPVNAPRNPVNFPMPPNYGVPNSQHRVQQCVAPLNQDPRAPQMHNNNIVNNDSSVPNNQRLSVPPNSISTTGYNANGIVPNPQVPPTSGVSNVEPVNRQPFYPTPPTHAGVAQGGPHQPPSNNPRPHPIFPPLPTLPGPTHPVPTPQPIIHPWTQQPVYIIPPSAPKSRSASSTTMPPSSSSDLVVTRPRKRRQRPKDDDESVVNNSQKRSRVDRPAEYLYEEIKKGKKYACRYAGPAQPGGCKAPTFTSISNLSTHIMLVHAKREGEMNLPFEQRVAYNGLPPNLRSVHVVCPLPDAELMRCKYYCEKGQRWEAHVMDTPEHAVHSHMASDHA